MLLCLFEKFAQWVYVQVLVTKGRDHGLEAMFQRSLGIFTHADLPFLGLGVVIRICVAQNFQCGEMSPGMENPLHGFSTAVFRKAWLAGFGWRSVAVAHRRDPLPCRIGGHMVDAMLHKSKMIGCQRHDIDADMVIVCAFTGTFRRLATGMDDVVARPARLVYHQQIKVGIRPVVAARSGAEQNHLFDTIDLCDGLCNTAGVFVMIDDGGDDRKDVHASMVAPRTEVSWCVWADWVQVHLNPYAFGRPVGRVTLQIGVESTSCVIGLPSDSQDPDLHQQLERLHRALLYQSRDPTKYTVGWGLAMAGSTLMILPVILVFFMAQRFFIQGIAVSGIKV